jgi:diguanylate cyclase (GGDEF)-like protein
MATVAPHPIAARVRGLLEGPQRVWLFILGVAAACAAVWAHDVASYAGHPFDPHGVTWWQLAAAFYLAEVFVVHLHFRKQAHTLSLAEIGLVVGLMLASPANLLAAQLVGTAPALLLNRRQRPMKFAFNLVELPLCTGVAVMLFRTLASPGDSRPHLWLVALLVAAAAHALGVGLVSLVIAVAEGRLNAPQLATTLSISLLGAVSTASLGLAAVELFDREPSAVLLLLAPALVCAAALREYMKQREQREHVEFLYESMRATQGAPEFGLAIGQLLVAARRLLRAEFAEILLVSPGEAAGPIRSVSGPLGEVLMRAEEAFGPAEQEAFAELDAQRVPLLLDRRRERQVLDALLVTRNLEEAVIAPLRGERGTFGLLLVGDRTGDVGTFDESDVDLFKTFAGHASVLLENGRLEHSLAQVTELKEQLRHQAYHDALTGLANRIQFVEAVRAKLEEGDDVQAAVLYVDLDRFKAVNDTWGHGAGDELLVQVAERLRGAVRRGDLAARLGGDEFAVLLPRVDEEIAREAADRVARALGGSYTLAAGEAAIQASVGIALAGAETTRADELVRNADIAMYTAKRSNNRSCVLYEEGLHEKVRSRREFAIDLERAVRAGEITAYFQPIVNLADGRVEGVEALARWRHPQRGLLPAAAFLPTAEESGLMIEIGAVVIRQAIAAAQTWPHEIGVWLNLAPAELTNQHLIDTLAIELARAGVHSNRLTVEITESGLMEDEDAALEAVHRLRDLGVHLSIDDFGTGYSSLSRLGEFPIESLKIPKPFVEKLVGAERDETFVDTILQLAKSLGLTVIAEGIEERAQLEQLRALGCRLGQGYLFSHPVPATEIDALVRARHDETARVVPLHRTA